MSVNRSAGRASLTTSALSLLLVLIGMSVQPSSVLAQPSDAPAQKPRGAHALDLATEGVKLYEIKQYDDALARFTAAEALVHSPVFQLYQARCLREQGKLLPARRLLRKLAEESLGDEPPAPWVHAQQDAAAEGSALDQRLGRLVFTVVNGSSAVRGSVDGQVIALSELAHGIELLPGKHLLAVVDGKARASRAVELRAGELTEVNLVVPAIPRPLPTPAPNPLPPAPVVPPADAGGSLVPGAITLAVAGAFGIAGGVLGGVALSRAAAVKDACAGVAFCPEQRDERDAAIGLGNGATVMLSLAGAAAAAGVILLAVQPGAASDSPVAEASLQLGPGWLGVRGRF